MTSVAAITRVPWWSRPCSPPARAVGFPGTQILESVIVGYDVALRVLETAGRYRAHNGRGWHSTGTCGSFGAAAAVAKSLTLDVAGTVSGQLRRTCWRRTRTASHRS
jgi:2-methylcitrate dehydratase MmgE/PrpD-like protein